MKTTITLIIILLHLLSGIASAEIVKTYDPAYKMWVLSSMYNPPDSIDDPRDRNRFFFFNPSLIKCVSDKTPSSGAAFMFEVWLSGTNPIFCNVDRSFSMEIKNDEASETFSLVYDNRKNPAQRIERDENIQVIKYTSMLDKNGVIINKISNASALKLTAYYTNCQTKTITIPNKVLSEWKEMILWTPTSNTGNVE